MNLQLYDLFIDYFLKEKCPPYFISINNNCYFFSLNITNWKNSVEYCKFINSTLLTLFDTNELEHIKSYLYSKRKLDFYHKTHVNMLFNSTSSKLDFSSLPLCSPVNISNKKAEKSVIFFSKTLNTPKKCFTVNININSNKSCILMHECEANLPFICKLNLDQFRNKKFYKHNLHDYQQDPKMSYLMNSFLALIHGLDAAHRNVSTLYYL